MCLLPGVCACVSVCVCASLIERNFSVADIIFILLCRINVSHMFFSKIHSQANAANIPMHVCVYDRQNDSASPRLGHNVKHNKRDASRRIRTSSHRQTQIHTHTDTCAQAAPKCSRHAPTSLAPYLHRPPPPLTAPALLCRRQLIHFACYF